MKRAKGNFERLAYVTVREDYGVSDFPAVSGNTYSRRVSKVVTLAKPKSNRDKTYNILYYYCTTLLLSFYTAKDNSVVSDPTADTTRN
eukprot:CCRYP_016000-RB/>CCRYP_016000-RB protein AED:0.25 eAED:0.14 QI:22/1/0.66/1/0.5/0.33/3/822/87